MKSLWGRLAALTVLAMFMGFGTRYFYRENQELVYQLKLAEIKKDFLIAQSGLMGLPQVEYRQELGILLGKYFNNLKKLADDFPDNFVPDRERQQLERDVAGDRLNKAQAAIRLEGIELVAKVFENMQAGNFVPLYTAADQNFRFDIFEALPVQSSQGEKQVRLYYAHWGAFGPVNYYTIVGNPRPKPGSDRPKTVPQFVAEGQMPVLQIQPERWIAEFPPGVEVGYYELPALPSDTETLELAFDFGIRTVGGSMVLPHVVFKDIMVPDSWKLAPGQAWAGNERQVDKEDFNAASGAAPKVRD